MRVFSFAEVLHLIEVAAIVGAAVFAGYQLQMVRQQLLLQRQQSSADFALRLNNEFDKPAYKNLSNALDSDPGSPILKPRGKFSVFDLDWYLGQYETLDDLYRSGLITCPMMYNEFSYNLEQAYKNKDVKVEIAEERKGDPGVWSAFLDLAKQFENGYHCPK